MNGPIEWLNEAGRIGMTHAGAMLWQVTLLVGMLLAMDIVLGRRVRAVVRHGLWLLVPVKLLLPPSMSLPSSPAYWLGSVFGSTERHATRRLTVDHDIGAPSAAVPAEVGGTARRPSTYSNGAVEGVSLTAGISVEAGWLVLWLVGCAGIGWRLLYRAGQVQRLLSEAKPAGQAIQECLRSAAAELGMARWPTAVLSEAVSSPSVCGWFRPAVVLPPSLVRRLAPDRLRIVLLHELAHVKRMDLWVSHLQAVLQTVYWWHPLVWLANRRIRRVREEATDETVVVALRGETEGYASTLVEAARAALSRPGLSLGFMGILESRNALSSRVRRLLDGPKIATAQIGFWQKQAIVLGAAMLLPMAPGPLEAIESSDGATAPKAGTEHAIPAPEVHLDRYAVAPEDANAATGELISPGRLTRLGRITFEQGLQNPRSARPAAATPGSVDDSLRAFAEAAGVSVAPPNALSFDTRNGTIAVRATAAKVDTLERAVDPVDSQPPIIRIEARILEVSASELRRLGWDRWRQNGTQGTTNLAIVTDPQAREILRACEQRGLRAIAAPRIVTLDRQQARIEIGERPERRTGDESIALDVLPEVESDGYTLRVRFTCRLTEFVDLRGGPATGAPEPAAVPSGAVYAVNAVGYITRTLAGSPRMRDGQTILAASFGAALPGVGGNADRGFLLFVSPVLIDPAGNPIHTGANRPFPLDQIPDEVEPRR